MRNDSTSHTFNTLFFITVSEDNSTYSAAEMEDPALASLSLTHVNYVSLQSIFSSLLTNSIQNPADPISYLCAWLALVPQGLCVTYVTLIWSTREIEVILMFAGQMGCEALNFLLKRIIKEERPRRISAFYHRE